MLRDRTGLRRGPAKRRIDRELIVDIDGQGGSTEMLRLEVR
jgi:hypothetical protein